VTTLLIYGANGYTGRLIAIEAVRRGLDLILAGRDAIAIGALATELGVRHRVFTVADAAPHLSDVEIVLHCAGPFSVTSAPMIEACIQSRSHYLDLTGEIEVFEHAFAQHTRAQQAGIVLCAGVGFDVIPTDCAAVAAARALPGADQLAVGMSTSSSYSPGTLKTVLEVLASGGKVRQHGEIVQVRQAWKTRSIDFGNSPRQAMTVPLGDVSTALYSTGIPTIEYYAALPPTLIRIAKIAGPGSALLRLRAARTLLAKLVDAFVSGPSEDERRTRTVRVWAEVTDAHGATRVARVTTSSIYDVTIHGALAVAEHLSRNETPGGAYTPAMLAGPDLITTLPGASSITITES
jgi:short subunit dehydrogenase-like uncharacterized protein